MDVSSDEWSQREFNILKTTCLNKKDWMCTKTDVACKDYLCPIVKKSADIIEVRKNFKDQK